MLYAYIPRTKKDVEKIKKTLSDYARQHKQKIESWTQETGEKGKWTAWSELIKRMKPNDIVLVPTSKNLGFTFIDIQKRLAACYERKLQVWLAQDNLQLGGEKVALFAEVSQLAAKIERELSIQARIEAREKLNKKL